MNILMHDEIKKAMLSLVEAEGAILEWKDESKRRSKRVAELANASAKLSESPMTAKEILAAIREEIDNTPVDELYGEPTDPDAYLTRETMTSDEAATMCEAAQDFDPSKETPAE